MSLNPVQFGTEVIDPFGRYLMATFPIADPAMGPRCALGRVPTFQNYPFEFVTALSQRFA